VIEGVATATEVSTVGVIGADVALPRGVGRGVGDRRGSALAVHRVFVTLRIMLPVL
jgi:hypothetical protein